MANPIGNELVQVIGVSATGGLSGIAEYFTTKQISNLGGGSLTTTRIITTGVTDSALVTDALIGWNSATASAKSETILAPTTKGQTLTVKDERGTASTYPITITPASGTIDNAATYILNSYIKLKSSSGDFCC